MSKTNGLIIGLMEAVEYAKGNKSLGREVYIATETKNITDSFNLKADQIADWFIAYNNSQEDSDYMTNLKLQKLLYYAQGITIKYTGKTLFKEPLLAWKYGAVVKNVYDEYSSYGKKPIDLEFEVPKFGGDVDVILQDVYDEYGQYASWKLVKMVHDESPWKETSINDVITIDKMRDFFGR